MRAGRSTGARVHWERLTAIRTLVLIVAGFGFLVTAAFLLDYRAGFASLGIALLVLEYLTGDSGRGERR